MASQSAQRPSGGQEERGGEEAKKWKKNRPAPAAASPQPAGDGEKKPKKPRSRATKESTEATWGAAAAGVVEPGKAKKQKKRSREPPASEQTAPIAVSAKLGAAKASKPQKRVEGEHDSKPPRKKSKRGESSTTGQTGSSRPETKGTAWEEEPEKKHDRDDATHDAKASKERIACTVFVGQLPYSASEADIKRHFKSCASDGEVRVRLLTKRAEQGGGSRGMAFVELASEAAVHTALRLHHSVMSGRRINVERTVGGGGTSGDRKQKLELLREKQGKQMVQTVKELCETILPEAADEVEEEERDRARVVRADVDERVLEFLCTVPTSLAEEALREAKALDMNGVRNRSAYLMGVLKRRVAESDSVKAVEKIDGNRGPSSAKERSSWSLQGDKGKGWKGKKQGEKRKTDRDV